jgi:hypothetical protein
MAGAHSCGQDITPTSRKAPIMTPRTASTASIPAVSTPSPRLLLATAAIGLPLALLFCQALQQGRSLLASGWTEMLIHCAFMR